MDERCKHSALLLPRRGMRIQPPGGVSAAPRANRVSTPLIKGLTQTLPQLRSRQSALAALRLGLIEGLSVTSSSDARYMRTDTKAGTRFGFIAALVLAVVVAFSLAFAITLMGG